MLHFVVSACECIPCLMKGNLRIYTLSRWQIGLGEGCVCSFIRFGFSEKKTRKKKTHSNFKLSPIERGRKYIPDSEMISYCTSAPGPLVNQIEMLWLKFHYHSAHFYISSSHFKDKGSLETAWRSPSVPWRRPPILIRAISPSKVRSTYHHVLVSKSQSLLRWEDLGESRFDPQSRLDYS